MTNTGIYIHVPYCTHRCSYCDFYSSTSGYQSNYQDSVQREIEQMASWWEELVGHNGAQTVFWGGGTPSLLPVAVRSAIMTKLSQCFQVDPTAEVTIETNPENVSKEFLDDLQCSGVNRISLGVQSFDDEYLRLLDRKVPKQRVLEAVREVQSHRDWNWSLDLIMGIPGQTVSRLRQDLLTAIRLSPKHLSVYSLTLKPAHVLYDSLPEEELSAELYECTTETLEEAGYQSYEISNFAQPGYECRHNLLYWDGSDFVGLGPSAASRYFNGVFHHRKQVSDLERYFRQLDPREIPFEGTSRYQSVLEAMFLELRKDIGIDLAAFEARYGVRPTKSPRFSELFAGGFLTLHDQRLQLTSKGRLIADTVTAELVDKRRVE